MANSKGKITDTSSTKSSMLLSKVASLKQSVKHGAKVLGRPFKKLKTFIAMAASSCLTHSHSMVSLPTSEASPSENCPIRPMGPRMMVLITVILLSLALKRSLVVIYVTLYLC